MKIIYISTVFPSVTESATIYTDLAEALAEAGHEVTVVAATEKKKNLVEGVCTERGCRVLRAKTGNMYDVNIIEKGISVLTLSHYMKRAMKRHLRGEHFDLILFEAPPATLAGVVEYAKKLYQAPAYLMMKDIFPQNAVDIGIMGKGLLYRFFCRKEKKLYKTADYIGCMSRGNCDYIAEHNKVPREKLEIFPNTKKIAASGRCADRVGICEKLGIPTDKTVFILGGNMGKPQGMPFLCRMIRELEAQENAFFVLVGRGTERTYAENELRDCRNVKIFDSLPRDEYEKLVPACDVGIVSLDYRFTIPNYPSRVLSYMEQGMPVLATTDRNTDFKELIQESGCGIWCSSDSPEDFKKAVNELTGQPEMRAEMGRRGRDYMEQHFDVSVSVEILSRFG